MFYAEAILSRRGPLAKVWLAAHWERKLSKTQTLQTDITQSVDAIVGQEVVPMALRLSGQLLLGVCRIYSRKAKYLLDDCNEALLKIKMAFRPGMVDMTEDQLTVNRNAITLQGDGFDFELMPDANWDMAFDRPIGQGTQHIARQADITLADNMHFDLDDPNYDFDLGPADGIGSQDFDFDIGIDFGDADAEKEKKSTKSKKAGPGGEDDDMSIEVGRDADPSRVSRLSIDSHLRGGDDFDAFDTRSHGGLGDFGAPEDFGGDMPMDLDLGIDFGDEPHMRADRPKTPEAVHDASRPSTAPPVTPPQQQEGEAVPQVEGEQTPRAAEQEPAKKKKATLKKVIIDPVTELEDGPGGRMGYGGINASTRDVSDITAPHEFLPRSRTVMALMHIRNDPLAHFMPTVTNERGTFFCAAPPGIPAELTNLFMFPTHTQSKHRRNRAVESDVEGRSPKRARLGTEDPELEVGMRNGSRARSFGVGSDPFGRNEDVDFGGDIGLPMDDLQMDLGASGIDIDGAVDGAKRRASKKPAASDVGDEALELGADFGGMEEDRRSRFSTPAEDLAGVAYSDAICPIAAFDTRPSKDSQTQTATQATPEDEEAEAANKDGYSKQTVKAISLLRRHLKASDVDATPRRGQAVDTEKTLSFKELSNKASRRAAASFFFELLVLGTRDAVKLHQEDKAAHIQIKAKDKLWDAAEASQATTA